MIDHEYPLCMIDHEYPLCMIDENMKRVFDICNT